MRGFIAVNPKPFSLDECRDEIALIVQTFGRYLDGYPTKTSRTKHGLLGPVGKVIQGVKSRKWQAQSLIGYALNIHTANRRTRGFISPESSAALADGVERLMSLYDKVPPAFRERLLDQVDYGLYYLQRKKSSDWLENRNVSFRKFVRERYATVDAALQAWGDKPGIAASFDELRFSAAELAKAKGKKREDLEGFRQRFAEAAGEEIEEEQEA
jgi:hypothetical protein